MSRTQSIPKDIVHLGFVCYDDACHLTKFAKNPLRADLTPQAKQLASVQMVVDKMHMKGHVDKWCKENCDAKCFADLDKVHTHINTNPFLIPYGISYNRRQAQLHV